VQPRTLVLGTLFTAEVLVMLDGMVVAVALPAIGDDVGLQGAELQWAVTAYTVPLGACLLLGGRLADRHGRRRVLLAGLALFALGSLGAGVADSAAALLASRAVAGIGAALAIPAALALVTAATRQGNDRNRVLGLMSATIDIGMVVGAMLGGLVVYALGWRWVFLFVVPIAISALAFARSVVAESRADDPPPRLDWLGAALATGGLGLAIVGLAWVERRGLDDRATLGALGAAAVLLSAFLALQRRTRFPLLPLGLFRLPGVTAANALIVVNAGAFGGTVVLSTLLMQRGLGFSALEAGIGFVPLAASALAGGLLAPRAILRLGAPRAIALSLVASGLALGWVARDPANAGYWAGLFPAYLISGAPFAVAAVPLTALAVGPARPGDRALAAGLFQTSTHVGGAAVLAVLVLAAAAGGLRVGFLVAAGLLLGAAAASILLLRDPHLHLERDVAAEPGAG
jgi:MFS family permease